MSGWLKLRPPNQLRLAGLGFALALIFAAVACTTTPGSGSDSSGGSAQTTLPSSSASRQPTDAPSDCAHSEVHRDPLPAPMADTARIDGPTLWVGSERFAAVLLFSTEGDPTMHTGGIMPDGRQTKILWVVPGKMNGPLVLNASTQTGATFIQKLGGAGDTPSIIDVPSAGCWTFALSAAGQPLGSVILPVVD